MGRPKNYSVSTPVKNFIEWRLEHYHEDKEYILSIKRGSRKLHEGNAYLKATELTVRAIDKVLRGLNPEDHQLVHLVYWQKTHTIVGAGIQLNMTSSTAHRHMNAVICSIAKELGYIS